MVNEWKNGQQMEKISFTNSVVNNFSCSTLKSILYAAKIANICKYYQKVTVHRYGSV